MPSDVEDYPELDYEQVLTVSIEMFGVVAASHNVTIHVITCASFDSIPVFAESLYEFEVFVGEDWLFTLP